MRGDPDGTRPGALAREGLRHWRADRVAAAPPDHLDVGPASAPQHSGARGPAVSWTSVCSPSGRRLSGACGMREPGGGHDERHYLVILMILVSGWATRTESESQTVSLQRLTNKTPFNRSAVLGEEPESWCYFQTSAGLCLAPSRGAPARTAPTRSMWRPSLCCGARASAA